MRNGELYIGKSYEHIGWKFALIISNIDGECNVLVTEFDDEIEPGDEWEEVGNYIVEDETAFLYQFLCVSGNCDLSEADVEEK